MVFLHFSFGLVAILGFTLRKGVNIEKSIAIQNVGYTLCDGVIFKVAKHIRDCTVVD